MKEVKYENLTKITNQKSTKIKNIDRKLKHKVYRNPKLIIKNKKSPDYYVEDINELWDINGLDRMSKALLENTLSKACIKKQTPNIVLIKRNTKLSITKLKKDLIYIFEKRKKFYIKQVMLFYDKDSLILYLKRK